MNIKRLVLVPVLLAAASWPLAHADDTDLYIDPNSAYGTEPLVMFNLDYNSNFGSSLCTSPETCEKTAYFRRDDAPQSVKDYMAKVIDSGKYLFRDQFIMVMMEVMQDETLRKVHAGLMMSHDDANLNKCAENKCSNGAFFLQSFQPLYVDASRAEFLDKLMALPEAGNRFSHHFQGKESYFELFRYLKGGAVHNGFKSYNDFADTGLLEDRYANNGGIDPVNNIDYNKLRMDSRTLEPNTKNYRSPLSIQCTKVFVINILFQNTQSEDESDTEILAEMTGIDPSTNKLTFEDVLEYMNDNDLNASLNGSQHVTSYFISAKGNTKTDGYAVAGGTGKAFLLSEENPEVMVDSITRIFKEILSVSTTFVAASVPVNVFNRSESLDNVFIALFQAETRPFWTGNLKKLKIKTETVEIKDETGKVLRTEFRAYLVDSLGNEAVAADGRIRYDALTYWTDASTGNLPGPEGSDNDLAVEGKDGRIVNRGGAGQKIPGFLGGTGPGLTNAENMRQLFYDPADVTNSSTSKALSSLDADDTTAADLQTALEAASVAEAKELLEYARGYDPATDLMRGWLLGDPLHSRPLPINYGNIADPTQLTDDPDIYIAMAAQDGFMHFFRNSNGNENNAEAPDGEEVWAFMPRAVMGELDTFRDNLSDEEGGDGLHPYTVDGAPAVYLHDDNQDGTIRPADNDRAVLYFGLRRGGRAYYAIDVTSPESPSLLWRITHETTGFSRLGQSWSTPRVGKVSLDVDSDGDNDDVPIVAFAGGYNPNKDRRVGEPVGYDGIGTADTDSGGGNAIYIVNALSGDLIWKADPNEIGNATHAKLTDSIPSDVTLVDTDGNGYSDRILVGDTGGKVWRVDIGGAKSNWKITLLADLGSGADRAEDRRFFHAPDIVQSQEADGTSFDAVIIGSGDRPNPLDRPRSSTLVKNWMFMIKDTEIEPNVTDAGVDTVNDLDPADGSGLEIGDLKNADECLATACSAADLQNGWKLPLIQGKGEKSLSTPLTIDNTVYFTTYLPLGLTNDESSGVEELTCGPAEGKGLLYAVSLADARPKLNYNEYNDSENGGTDENPNQDASDRFRELASQGIPADVVNVSLDGRTMIVDPGLGLNQAGESNRWRTFWYNVESADD